MGSSPSKSQPPKNAKKKETEKEQDFADQWDLFTYLPTWDPDLEYSHTHFLYTNDLKKLEDVPPPHPTPTRKHEVFDAEKYADVDARIDALPKDVVEKTVPDLVATLVEGCQDDYGAVRAVYRYLTAQPIERMVFKKPPKSNTMMFQLYAMKEKRNTYAQLFSLLCGYADLPCPVIRGYLKGSTYEVGQKIDKATHQGEWNAVLVEGSWRLVNAFWGACVLAGEDQEEYWYSCDENFFLTDPQELIYTHFPESPEWQLISNKKTLKEFETMAYLKDRFFSLDMRVLSHPNCLIEARDGEVEILFGLQPQKSSNLEFMCVPTIFTPGRGNRTKAVELPQKNVSLDFIHQPNENVLSLKVRFPQVGLYKIEIVGRDCSITQPEYDFDWIAIYKVDVKSIPKKQVFFPITEPVGWGPGKHLAALGLEAVSHKTGVIKQEPGRVTVKFKIIDPAKAAGVSLFHHLYSMEEDADQDIALKSEGFREQDGYLILNTVMKEGEFKMKICSKTADGGEVNVCNYHVISELEKLPTPTQEKDNTEEIERQARTDRRTQELAEIRQSINRAIDLRNLEDLERSVDMIESRGFQNQFHSELKLAKDLIARLKRIQKLLHEVMQLNQRTIAEIRSYSNPKGEIHKVMQATLLLLGNYENETKDWKNVQALIGKTGKESLKRRIQQLDINVIQLDIALGARQLIGHIDLEDIVTQSAGAATFYTWAMGIIEELETRHSDQVASTLPRTNRGRAVGKT